MTLADDTAMCHWLAANVSAIASDESAGQCYSEIANIIKRIEHTINRPHPKRTCGPCPTVLDDHTSTNGHGRQCAHPLEARQDQIEITCPACKTTHNVENLITKLILETEHMRFTIPELADLILPRIPESYVPQSTLYDWHAKGLLRAAGYRRHDGRTLPVFRLADVRKLRAEQPKRKAKAG